MARFPALGDARSLRNELAQLRGERQRADEREAELKGITRPVVAMRLVTVRA